MNRYLLLLCTKTSIRFVPEEARYRFNIGEQTITFRRIESVRDKMVSELSHGFIIEVKLTATTIDKAISEASGLAERFLSVFCLETVCEVYPARVILAYDITEDLEKRPFKQYFRNLAISSAPTQVTFSSFCKHLEEIRSFNSQDIERNGRAIRWFRKGVIADDPLDQFLFFWHGLEALNSPLAKHFQCKQPVREEIEGQCLSCGTKYTYFKDNLGGVKALFNNMDIKQSIYKEIKRIRTGISHGFENLLELSNSALNILPTMAKVLHCGIATILDISFEKKLVKNFERIAPIKLGQFCIMDAFLCEKDLTKLGKDNYYPFFIHESKNVGTIENGFNQQLAFQSHTGCRSELWGVGIAGKNLQLEITAVQ